MSAQGKAAFPPPHPTTSGVWASESCGEEKIAPDQQEGSCFNENAAYLHKVFSFGVGRELLLSSAQYDSVSYAEEL